MATSDVAIANLALQYLGEGRIESLTENSDKARSLNAAFVLVRQAELRRHLWSFAIKRASIAADADQTLWGDWNQYLKPNDFLRLIRDDESGLRVDWRIEGNYIISADTAPLEIRYVADIEDPIKFDSLFTVAFATALAKTCAKAITGNSNVGPQVTQDYKDAIAEAKKIGAIESGPTDPPEDDWILAML